MPLTASENKWLKAYRKAISRFGVVRRMVIYGSKARGDDNPDSDLDILLIIKDKAARQKRELRYIGYDLAATGELVPSILVYTQKEWDQRRRSGSPFREAVERDKVRVL
jgi:predicted nucleotidyltransferase